jgi:hypothetical protein
VDDHATHARVDELTTTRLLGLPGFVVVAAGEVGGELEVLIETTQTVTGCPDCGVLAVPHGRREHMVRDVPSANRAVRLGVVQADLALPRAGLPDPHLVRDE